MPNIHQWSIHSNEPTIQCLPPKCSGTILKMGTVVCLSLLHINIQNKETAGNTRPTSLNPLRSHGHMVGVSTDIVNTGTLPALTFGPFECDILPIT